MNYRIEALGGHGRATFNSGSEPLDRYLREQASQDARRNTARCFVAVTEAEGTIAGFYTLAASSLLVGELPDPLIRKLPRYPHVPAALLGRLAVDGRHQGAGLGRALVADAIQRAARADLAAFALVVDAKDATVAAFYRRLGFENSESEPLRLFLHLASAPRLNSGA